MASFGLHVGGQLCPHEIVTDYLFCIKYSFHLKKEWERLDNYNQRYCNFKLSLNFSIAYGNRWLMLCAALSHV